MMRRERARSQPSRSSASCRVRGGQLQLDWEACATAAGVQCSHCGNGRTCRGICVHTVWCREFAAC